VFLFFSLARVSRLAVLPNFFYFDLKNATISAIIKEWKWIYKQKNFG